MSLKLNTASGGSITLQEADTASNLTLTVPAQAGSIVTADSSGNVGIGTSSPSSKARLTVDGVTGANTGGGILITGSGYQTNPSGMVLGQYTSTIAYIQAPANGQLEIWDDATNGIVRFLDNGNLQFNSGYGSAATAYGCRAWVNFNGTGTVAIRASGNVTSISDNATANFTVNFTTSMPDVNYAVTGTCGHNVSSATTNACRSVVVANGGYATGSVNVITQVGTGSAVDMLYMNVAIFR